MNADSILSAVDPGLLSPDALLAPIAPEAPCGASLRNDGIFTEIRLLREEDDPALPMGQWERPLKRADWPHIAHVCGTILATRSKDLQLAMWLVEAWTRQRGCAGLADGLRLVEALLRRYWPCLHPVILDDGDSDARLAPLEWLNEALSACLRLHAPLFTVALEQQTAVTLVLWERLTAQDMTAGAPVERKAAPAAAQPLTRADILAHVNAAQASIAGSAALCRASLDSLAAIDAFLHEQLQDGAPALGKLGATLEAALRVLAQCQTAEVAPAPVPDAVAAPAPAAIEVAPTGAPLPPIATLHWRNRREAYATLDALADYLSDVEPHSPTPFLIRRAAQWGRMSLPEVIADIIREDGDVGRLFQMLGIKL